MKHIVSLVLACTLCATSSMTPARAGEDMDASDKSVLVLSIALATPLFLSGSVVQASTAPHRPIDRKPQAGALPPMKVTAVRTHDDGGREVELVANVQGKDEVSTLRWPRRDDDPAAAFRVGQTVTFKPSTEGAGWMLRDEGGADLAFVPTVEAAGRVESRTW